MKTRKTHPITWFAFWLIFLIIIIIIFAFLRSPSLSSSLSQAFTRQPERFTELYFTDHLSLPSKIELVTPYSFEFTVHNLEYRDFTYDYEVNAEEGENKIAIEKGNFTLEQDAAKTIPVTFCISKPFERIKVTVNLINKNQPIHFWIEQEKS